MQKKIVYNLFLGLVFILRKMPRFLRRSFFKVLAKLGFLFASKTNRIIKANLRLIFKDNISEKEIKEIQEYSYFNMLLWAQSMIENLDVSNEELKQNIQIENVEILEKLKEEKRAIILISAHYGNMEMLSCYLNKFVLPIHQVARESNFEEIDEFIVKAREASGAKIIFRTGAVKKLVKALMKKETVSLIIDQNINSKEGTEVEFLGVKANQTTTSSILARKFNAVLVPVAIFNKDDYKYNIKVYEPISAIKTDDEEDDLKKLSQLQANAISAIILEDKKQWFWPHKRFKSHYKEIYDFKKH